MAARSRPFVSGLALLCVTLVGCHGGDAASTQSPDPRPPRVVAVPMGEQSPALGPVSAAPADSTSGAGTPEDAPAFDPELASLLDRATLPELPEWTDRWFETHTSEQRHFAIDVLMRELGVSRAAAVEVQNHHRDAMRVEPSLDPRVAFTRAVARVRGGEFEDRRALDRLATARVIVVFDLDETLYDQSLDAAASESTGACSILRIPVSHEAPTLESRRIALAPDWEAVFDRVHAMGGVVVLFTANLDDLTWSNLAAWSWREGTVLDHPALAGVLTNSHLVRRSRHEAPTTETDDAATGRRRPVWMEPSKDLRIVDETLSRVVLVDDNPHRVAQFDRLRVLPKLDGDAVCQGEATPSRKPTRAKSGGAEKTQRLDQPSLLGVVTEIEGSLKWAEANGVSFAAAYLPHTLMGRVVVDELQATRGWSRARAIEWVRRNPSRVARDF
jgi:hypothetical protein